VVDVVSAVRLEEAEAGTRLNWSATSDVSGTVAVYEPAARPATSTASVSTAGAAARSRVAVSQSLAPAP